MREESEEARQWDRSQDEDEGSSSPEASTKHATLDDRNIWNAKDSEDS